MKNWEPFVLGPLLAMESRNGLKQRKFHIGDGGGGGLIEVFFIKSAG
jgi:hypothetical protein